MRRRCTAPLRVGLAAFRGSNGGGTATFDWFRVHAGSEAGGPSDCAAHVPDEVGLVRRGAQHPAVELPASHDAGDR